MQNQTFETRGHHTVEHDPFIKSQLASRNWLQGLMWCKFGHVPPENGSPKTVVLHRVVLSNLPLVNYKLQIAVQIENVMVSKHIRGFPLGDLPSRCEVKTPKLPGTSSN